MRRFNSSTAFMIVLLLMVGAMVIGCMTFLNQMNGNYIMIQKGITPVKHVLNHHKYVQNKRGFIFSVTFLIVTGSLFIMIALPSEEKKTVIKRRDVPQPIDIDREDSAISAIVEPQKEVKPVEPVAPTAPSTAAKEEESEPPIEIIEHVEELAADFEDITEGEDDVVYGAGPISDAAIMHFVHKFPDSALKFLYRKQLDGKALTNVEEDIYQKWEERNLTRGKVKGYILTMMDWKEFPKKPLYETWKEVRDHIFENVD